MDEALSTFLSEVRLPRLEAVEIPIYDALGRVLAEDAVSNEDLPPFDRSAVDGYALRACDTFEASQLKPTMLKLTESDQVEANEAKEIWTGNTLPDGADAVVMLEYTRKVDGGIELLNLINPSENVSKKGEDVRKGDVAVKAGTRLKPHHIGMLAALGMTCLKVVRQPKVAILSTGGELVEPGEKPKPDQIINTNRLILSGMCRELSADPVDLGITKDDANEIEAKIRRGLEEADLVITTGGTSVGYPDLVPTVVSRLGSPGIIVHGVAMRPGTPTALAAIDNKPIFILSGYPVAAMMGFETFVRPVILKLSGVGSEPRPVLGAKLTRRVASALGRRVFLRVYAFRKNGQFYAEPIRTKGSGVLSTMIKANGYVTIPENREGLEEGETVIVHLFDKIGEEKVV